jgi:S-adenosylmethionine decarboxylase proenzyme
MQGIHPFGELYGCPAQAAVLGSAPLLRELCLRLAREAGLTVVGERFHQFAPQGLTGAVLSAESQLAIHTWPERGLVTMDVQVCNDTVGNTAKAE